ncbi:hypothetical protein [Brasilonema sp. UFV-L1]|uniref:hypothetical protein n=1 Tax=Brasilonema sp. UFV-L1 TaxID=2234130 RepID=UPI00145CFA81|nr:hypothetical protein [Brasilonema sp. UFV-L1]NMG09775.1 hypothetical protein [Brasilonema sp. UFV-L1]
MNPELELEVLEMLRSFNEYFSYLHGKSDAVALAMPTAAVAVWLEAYSDLNAEEREKAKAEVYRQCNFHPTPQQFKQLVKGTDEAEALTEWIYILDALRMSADDARARVEVLTPYARQALRAVGGLSGLGLCPEASLHKSIKEDFCRAHALIKQNMISHKLERINNSVQYVTKPESSIDIEQELSALTSNLSMSKIVKNR